MSCEHTITWLKSGAYFGISVLYGSSGGLSAKAHLGSGGLLIVFPGPNGIEPACTCVALAGDAPETLLAMAGLAEEGATEGAAKEEAEEGLAGWQADWPPQGTAGCSVVDGSNSGLGVATAPTLEIGANGVEGSSEPLAVGEGMAAEMVARRGVECTAGHRGSHDCEGERGTGVQWGSAEVRVTPGGNISSAKR